jgi:hypothetical protein
MMNSAKSGKALAIWRRRSRVSLTLNPGYKRAMRLSCPSAFKPDRIQAIKAYFTINQKPGSYVP